MQPQPAAVFTITWNAFAVSGSTSPCLGKSPDGAGKSCDLCCCTESCDLCRLESCDCIDRSETVSIPEGFVSLELFPT